MAKSDGNNHPWLIVGLGNPGREYENSRHNTGFMVIEKLLAALPAGRFEEASVAQSRVFCGKYRGKELVLQMPQTYMNLSGEAVGPLCRKLGLTPENVLVIVDDLDLPVGRIRLRKNGSSGGHNGLKSIIENLQSERFNRLRIGIGRSAGRSQVDYVLGDFSGEEKVAFERAIEQALEAVKWILKSGMDEAMNRFNAAPETSDEPNQANHLNK